MQSQDNEFDQLLAETEKEFPDPGQPATSTSVHLDDLLAQLSKEIREWNSDDKLDDVAGRMAANFKEKDPEDDDNEDNQEAATANFIQEPAGTESIINKLIEEIDSLDVDELNSKYDVHHAVNAILQKERVSLHTAQSKWLQNRGRSLNPLLNSPYRPQLSEAELLASQPLTRGLRPRADSTISFPKTLSGYDGQFVVECLEAVLAAYYNKMREVLHKLDKMSESASNEYRPGTPSVIIPDDEVGSSQTKQFSAKLTRLPGSLLRRAKNILPVRALRRAVPWRHK